MSQLSLDHAKENLHAIIEEMEGLLPIFQENKDHVIEKCAYNKGIIDEILIQLDKNKRERKALKCDLERRRDLLAKAEAEYKERTDEINRYNQALAQYHQLFGKSQ